MSLPAAGDRVCHCTAALSWASFPARQVEATFQQCSEASLSAIWRVCGRPGLSSGKQTGWPAAMMNEQVFQSQDFPLSLPPTAIMCQGPGSPGGRETHSLSRAASSLVSPSSSVLCLGSSGFSGAKLKTCSEIILLKKPLVRC